jgi:hypothetical protein
MPWLMEQWKKISGVKPFCLKGIQNVVNAKKAVELGVDGIVISNHAERQADEAIASLDALEKIVVCETCAYDIFRDQANSSSFQRQDLYHVRLWCSWCSRRLQGAGPRRKVRICGKTLGVGTQYQK